MFVFSAQDQSRPTLLPFPKGDTLKAFQKHVGGYIEMVPHPLGPDAPFDAYVNEEGLVDSLPSNPLSVGVLKHLGYKCRNLYGNIVLMGDGEKPLTKAEQGQVERALQKYLDEVSSRVTTSHAKLHS